MNTKEILDALQKEIEKEKEESYNAEGLLRLQEVARGYDGEYRLISSPEILESLASKPKEPLHPTGVAILDSIVGGLREQQLVTIAGHTGHGKTQFGLFLVEQLRELNPLVIPMEQSAEEIIDQRSSNGYSVPFFYTPFRLADKRTTDWIEERVVEGIAKYNTKLVLIDHLGYIRDDKNPRDNLAYRVGEITRALKNIAKKWNVVVVLLVHISQKEETKPPTMEDIKNSSDISQESDLVLTIWRKTTMKKKIIIREAKSMIGVHKNRRTGKTGTVGLTFVNGKYQEDNGWVLAMEQAAQQSVDADNEFDAI